MTVSGAVKYLGILAVLGLVVVLVPQAYAGTADTIWGTATPSGSGTGMYALGTMFTANVAGSVTAIRYYAEAGDGAYTGYVYLGSTAIASVSFGAPSSAGWVTSSLTTPVLLTAGSSYTVAVDYTDGATHPKASVTFPFNGVNSSLTATGSVNCMITSGSCVPTTTSTNGYYTDVVYDTTQTGSSTTTTTTSGSTTTTTTVGSTTTSTTTGSSTTTTTVTSGSTTTIDPESVQVTGGFSGGVLMLIIGAVGGLVAGSILIGRRGGI